MNLIEQIKLNKKLTWKGTHCGIPFEVCHWGVSEHKPQGNWNYYVYLSERLLGTEKFEPLWLEDKPYQITPKSPIRYSHDYYIEAFSAAEFHGGITWYEKTSYYPNQRCVQAGCDYNHLWDMEAGYPATLDTVIQDCLQSCEKLAAYFKLDLSA